MIWLRRAALLVATLVALVGVYLLAAVLAGLIPLNRNFVASAAGTPVWLCSNGIHTDLVLAAEGGPVDWAALLPPGLMRRPAAADAMLAFGWGDRAFYQATPTWAAFDPALALRAIAGNDTTVVHVEWRSPADRDPACLGVALDPSHLARLENALRATLAMDSAGRPIAIPGAGYGPADGFVVGTGHYSILLTCNDWLRRLLARAGIRTALWSPFPFGLLWQASWAGGRPGGAGL